MPWQHPLFTEMELSEFSLRLLLLFFPGVVCAYVVDALTIHRRRSEFEFLLNSLVLGIASYLVYRMAMFSWTRLSGHARDQGQGGSGQNPSGVPAKTKEQS